jgi:hypothetical protein
MKKIKYPKNPASLKRLLLVILPFVFLFSSTTVNAQLVSISPAIGQQGQTLTTLITGQGVQFQSSSPNGNILDVQLQKPGYATIYPDTSTINIIDNLHFNIDVSIPSAAAKGLYNLVVTVGPGNTNLVLTNAFRVGTPDGTVSGTVYYDSNNNGVKDAGEAPLANEKILVTPDSTYILTDPLGNYSLDTYNGSRTIEWKVSKQHYYLLSSANSSYTTVINNNNSSGNDFGLKSAIISVVPNQANAGQTLTTTITGADLFIQSSSPPGNILNFDLPGVFNFNVPSSGYNVLDSNNATVTFTVDGNAIAGIYDIALNVVDLVFPFDNITYILPSGFTIGQPDGYVSGTIYFDADTNGIRDPGEFGVQYTNLLLSPENLIINPDVSGNYDFGIVNGPHTVSMNMSSLGEFMLSSPDTSYNFTSNNNTTSGLDFGIRSHIYSITPDQSYKGQVLTTTITGVGTQFQSSSPQGNIFQMDLIKSGGGYTIPVPLNGINPLDATHFDALITVPVNADTGYYDVSVVVTDSILQWVYHNYILPHGFHISAGDVWPGDANYDLTADNNDVLNIGLAYGETGPVRAGASLNWIAQPATDWSGFFQTGVNKKHADCDGNGVVDNNDTLAISLNYGLTHPARLAGSNQNLSSSPPFYLVANPHTAIEGDTVEVDIFFGNSAIPVDSIYGVAFTMNFDTSLVDTSYMPFNYNGCWMGTPGVDLLTYTHKLLSQGKVDITLTRTDHQNIGGYGYLGKAGVVIVDNIGAKLGSSSGVNLALSISNVRALTATEYYLTVSTNGDNVIVDSSGVGNLNEMISIYPNPVKDMLTVNPGKVKINSLEIYNEIGEIVFRDETAAGKITVNTRNYSHGIYFLKLVTDAGAVNKKFSIIK